MGLSTIHYNPRPEGVIGVCGKSGYISESRQTTNCLDCLMIRPDDVDDILDEYEKERDEGTNDQGLG